MLLGASRTLHPPHPNTAMPKDRTVPAETPSSSTALSVYLFSVSPCSAGIAMRERHVLAQRPQIIVEFGLDLISR